MTTGSITMRAAVSRAVGEPFSVEEVDDDDRRSMIPFRGSQVLIGAQLALDLIEHLGEEARVARVLGHRSDQHARLGCGQANTYPPSVPTTRPNGSVGGTRCWAEG